MKGLRAREKFYGAADGLAAGAEAEPCGAGEAGAADAAGAAEEDTSGSAAGGGFSSVFWQAEARSRAAKVIIRNLRIISSCNLRHTGTQ